MVQGMNGTPLSPNLLGYGPSPHNGAFMPILYTDYFLINQLAHAARSARRSNKLGSRIRKDGQLFDSHRDKTSGHHLGTRCTVSPLLRSAYPAYHFTLDLLNQQS